MRRSRTGTSRTTRHEPRRRAPRNDVGSRAGPLPLPRFLAGLEGSGRRLSLLLYVRFALLSLRIPKGCRLATWSQVDLDGRTWRFLKMQREGAQEVVLPLHDGIMENLDRARALGRGDRSGWVFPNPLDLNAPCSMHAAQHVPEEFGYEVSMRDFVRVHGYWAEREPEAAAGGLPAWYGELKSTKATV